ncbi:MAG: 2-phospho-L-lactate transferase [Acidobacteria bacterium]|nr:2-phospho-L-lactate transferase [Acidobacteriota bacterium]MBI3423248.1 2-phospho-L-lactate transferase [Acidobacteriota bacterium]
MITALAGGVGASKLLDGLARALPPEELTIIVNTGDDIEMFGLYIAPDLDIVTYTLAGLVNPAMGWGVKDDSFHCLDSLLRFYDGERWFNLGDRDLATHIFRTNLLKQGVPLSEIAGRIRTTLGVRARILPMTDTHTPTTIITDAGEMHFQEYLVKHRAQPIVQGIRFENIAASQPAPGVLAAIQQSQAVIVCPSNPLISIGPILAVPGVRECLQQTAAKVIAVSPVVGGASLKGPTDRMLAQLGHAVSATQIARLYADFLDAFIIDNQDAEAKVEIEALGVPVLVTNTVMSGANEKLALAQITVQVVEEVTSSNGRVELQS